MRREARSLGMVAGEGTKRGWTASRVVVTVFGTLVALLGIFLVLWGVAMMANVIVFPVGIAFALLGLLLVFVGTALAGVPWFRARRRARHRA